jgi:lysophospholipase L1-like esterase
VIAIEVRRHHDLLVDLYQGTAAFATNPEDISDDGLHPTEEGYQLIATAFAQVLRAHHVIP